MITSTTNDMQIENLAEGLKKWLECFEKQSKHIFLPFMRGDWPVWDLENFH